MSVIRKDRRVGNEHPDEDGNDNPLVVDEQDDALRPKRPSLGNVFWAAVLSWAAAIAAERICWDEYVARVSNSSPGGWYPLPLLVAFAFLAVLLVVLVAVMRGRGRRGDRRGCSVGNTTEDRGAIGFRNGTTAKNVPVDVTATGSKRIAAGGFLLFLPVAAVFACSIMYWGAWAQDTSWLAQALDEQTLEVELVGDPAQRDYGLVSVARVPHGSRFASLRIIWPTDSAGERAGHKVKVAGSYKPPADDEAGRWNHQQGYLVSVKVAEYSTCGYASGLRGIVTPLRDSSMERISKLDASAAGLLAGVLLGDKTLYAASELEQDFKTTGLAHLMAVSGTHLAVVMLLVGWVFSRLPVSRILRALLTFLLLLGYVALTAFSPSALRALVMCAVGLSAFAFGRRRHLVSSLGICVVFFLGLAPNSAFSLGLALSVLCMTGILIFTPLIGVWIEPILPKRLKSTADIVAATLASSLTTLPVCVPLFAQLPLVSPISTMIASPIVTLLVGLGVPALLLTGPLAFAGDCLLNAASLAARLCAKLVHFLADIPFACLPLDSQAMLLGVLCALGAILLWVVWPLPSRHAGGLVAKACSLIAVSAPLVLVVAMGFGSGPSRISVAALAPSRSSPQVVMLDVGQGDSMLIRDGDAAVLIDTGEEGTVLLKALARHGVSRLDAVLLSHKDVDHTGALSSLAGVVEVGHVYIHVDLLDSPSCDKVRQAAAWASRQGEAEGVHRGDAIRAGRFSLSLLAPERGGESENDDSLIWLLSYSGTDSSTRMKGLLTGDGEEGAIASVLEDAGDIDFLKVGHHGSAGAVSDEEMQTLKPELSLISVGADNDYGHPTQQTLGVLERAGSRVLRTDLNGDITLAFNGDCIGVSCQKQ